MLGMLKQVILLPLELFGVVGHYESYSYSVVQQYRKWSVRRYAPAVAARVQGRRGQNYSFAALAAYIGVFGKPQNKRARKEGAEAVAMTVPVVSSSAIKMTVPVVNAEKDDSMQFILPSKYRSAKDAPVPTNPEVEIVDVPARYAAVLRWRGRCRDMEAAAPKYAKLEALMAEKGLKPEGPFELHRFNPPITLPAFRKNEIVVPVSEEDIRKTPRTIVLDRPLEQGTNLKEAEQTSGESQKIFKDFQARYDTTLEDDEEEGDED